MRGEALRRCVAAQSYSPQDVYHLPPTELAAKYIAVAGYSGEFSLSTASRILNSNAGEYYAEAIQFCLDHELLEAIPDNILRITHEGFKHIGAVFSLFYSPTSKTTKIWTTAIPAPVISPWTVSVHGENKNAGANPNIVEFDFLY